MPQYVSSEDYAAIQRMYGAKEAERLAKQYDWQVTLPEDGFTPIGGMGGGDSVDEANTNKVAQVPSGMMDSKTAGAGTPPTGGLSSEGEYRASQKRFTEQADANLNLLMEAQKALRERRLGPSNREKWFAIAAALGQPTRTGSFGESLGNLNKSLAEIAAERRKAEDVREELGLKYGLEISGQKLRMLQAAANEAGEVYRAELAANKPKDPFAGAVWDADAQRWVMRPGSDAGPPVLTLERAAELSKDPKNRGMKFYTKDGRLMEIK